ncbi:MAG: spore cortex-lytic enzyme [Firmicutes bacterium]|nr:spore cortex-lytic enzyme [Bacillota bacterium]
MLRDKKYLIKRAAGLLILFVLLICSFAVMEQGQVAQAVTLGYGSRGDNVERLQQDLRQLGYYSGAVDGIYGEATKAAVRRLQADWGLTADGIAGPRTLSAMGLELDEGGGNGSGSLTQSDITLLARAIFAEAEGEPYIGKVAVGAVLINRINSPDFPDTLSGVIYQSLALESVGNGRFDNSGSGGDCLKAAQEAANGWDPTYGCLYFWNPATATSSWIWTRQVVVTYGNHVFGI